MSDEINHRLCHRIVEHIKSKGIEFDTADIAEDIIEVLKLYGWNSDLSIAEQQLIFNDLYELALNHESAEIAFTCFGKENILESDSENIY